MYKGEFRRKVVYGLLPFVCRCGFGCVVGRVVAMRVFAVFHPCWVYG